MLRQIRDFFRRCTMTPIERDFDRDRELWTILAQLGKAAGVEAIGPLIREWVIARRDPHECALDVCELATRQLWVWKQAGLFTLPCQQPDVVDHNLDGDAAMPSRATPPAQRAAVHPAVEPSRCNVGDPVENLSVEESADVPQPDGVTIESESPGLTTAVKAEAEKALAQLGYKPRERKAALKDIQADNAQDAVAAALKGMK